jgi:hypothetical protein
MFRCRAPVGARGSKPEDSDSFRPTIYRRSRYLLGLVTMSFRPRDLPAPGRVTRGTADVILSEQTCGEAPVTWNTRGSCSFSAMNLSLSQLLEESFQIAWEYLERTGELGDGAIASRFLGDTIEAMIRRGQRSRLALSNRAISAYQRFRISSATVSSRARTTP